MIDTLLNTHENAQNYIWGFVGINGGRYFSKEAKVTIICGRLVIIHAYYVIQFFKASFAIDYVRTSTNEYDVHYLAFKLRTFCLSS